MRNGILLAEDTPANIMQMYNCSNLEDAFLILSQKQGKSEEADTTLGRVSGQKFIQSIENGQDMNTEIKIEAKEKEVEKEQQQPQHPQPTIEDDESSKNENSKVKTKLKRNLSFREQKPDGLIGKLTFTSQTRMKALLAKNILQLIRQPSWVATLQRFGFFLTDPKILLISFQELPLHLSVSHSSMHMFLLSDRRQPKESYVRHCQWRGARLANNVLQWFAGDGQRRRFRLSVE